VLEQVLSEGHVGLPRRRRSAGSAMWWDRLCGGRSAHRPLRRNFFEDGALPTAVSPR
jgi:hypothetical protein